MEAIDPTAKKPSNPPVKRKPLYTDDPLMAQIEANFADCYARLDALDHTIELLMNAMPAVVDGVCHELEEAENADTDATVPKVRGQTPPERAVSTGQAVPPTAGTE